MMQKNIVIILHSYNLNVVDWAILSDEGNILQIKTNDNLLDLAPFTKDANVTVIAPAEDVLLTTATLPKLSRHKLQQALPFSLEEHLIDDVTHLHFASGEYQTDGTIPVAVVSKDKMEQWISALKNVGIEPNVMLPMTLALPITEDQWQVYSYDNSHIIRTGKYSGFAADPQTFESVLDLKLIENPHIIIMPTNAELQPASEANTNNQWHDKKLLEKIAHTVSSLPFINLLQTPYSAKRKMTRMKNMWKYAGYLAAAWIATVLISNLISFFILHSQERQIDAQIDHIYYQNFPHATSRVAPRERLEQKLKEVVKATQKNNFLSLLATVGKSLSQINGIRLQNLAYHNGLLTLEVSSATFDNLDIWTRDLNAKGFTVKQQNSAASGSQVKATFLISAGAA